MTQPRQTIESFLLLCKSRGSSVVNQLIQKREEMLSHMRQRERDKGKMMIVPKQPLGRQNQQSPGFRCGPEE